MPRVSRDTLYESLYQLVEDGLLLKRDFLPWFDTWFRMKEKILSATQTFCRGAELAQ